MNAVSVRESSDEDVSEAIEPARLHGLQVCRQAGNVQLRKGRRIER